MLVTELLDGLAARLCSIQGLTVSTDPSATVAAPMAVVTDAEITYHETMVPRSLYGVDVEVTLYVSLADNEAGKIEARHFRSNSGSMSVAAALETSLGESVDSLHDVRTIVVNTSTVGTVASPAGEMWTAVRFLVTTHIEGAAS